MFLDKLNRLHMFERIILNTKMISREIFKKNALGIDSGLSIHIAIGNV